MPHPASPNTERAPRLQGALSRWDNNDSNDGEGDPIGPTEAPYGVPPLTNAELVQLQIRVIALENLVVALLTDASDQQFERVRDIADSIYPRPGVEHRLTTLAVAHMDHLTQRSLRW